VNVRRPTALIADDEPLLRDGLARQLAVAWPGLEIVAMARNGREAIRQFDLHRPDVCFLDVHMPGLSGIDAARHIGARAHRVFVTAHDQYAVQAFADGVLDYLVKPVEPARLAATVARVRERMQAARPAELDEGLLQQLAAALQDRSATSALRWIHAQAGQTLRLIAVDDIDFLQSDTKYTRIAWRNDGQPAEALVRTALKELLARLDPERFAQVHRAVVVNLHAISHVTRGDNDTGAIHLKGRGEVLPISRSFLHRFRQM
jgi:DNA-binding LytR/AlgR family response regulator